MKFESYATHTTVKLREYSIYIKYINYKTFTCYESITF